MGTRDHVLGLGNIAVRFCRLLPYKILIKVYPGLKKSRFSDSADSVLYEKFFKYSSLKNGSEALPSFLESGRNPILIQRGLWEYRLSNFCFVKDMLANIIWCIERGCSPIVDIYPPKDSSYSESQNLWELFYRQPVGIEKQKKTDVMKKCPIIISSIRPGFEDVRNSEMIKFWNVMLECFVKYNEQTQAYLDAEYEELIKGKRVVGCVLRSTDYTKLKPSGHPIQPSVDEVVNKLKEVMRSYQIDYIYLATEDSDIANVFKATFPDRVIENKRMYYNEQFNGRELNAVSQVHFERENDDYLKMLEYISSINLVSKCDCLVTGLNGGSEMAVYRNGNRYEYAYVFDKGFY